MTLSAVRVIEMINWERIVEQLSGVSAAMVVKAAQDAAKAAVLQGKKGITESDLRQAVAELRRDENPPHEVR
jgi:ATP-dependent 26S proteasome regulatory subunit